MEERPWPTVLADDGRRIPLHRGLLNPEKTRGWSVHPDTQVGDRIDFGDYVIEMIDEQTAVVVEES